MANPLKDGDAKLKGLTDLLNMQMLLPASCRKRRKSLRLLAYARFWMEVFL